MLGIGKQESVFSPPKKKLRKTIGADLYPRSMSEFGNAKLRKIKNPKNCVRIVLQFFGFCTIIIDVKMCA